MVQNETNAPAYKKNNKARADAVDRRIKLDAQLLTAGVLPHVLHGTIGLRKFGSVNKRDMNESVRQNTPFSQVAIATRLRALTATPPSPAEGEPPFDQALPKWLAAVTPLGADVLWTNTSVLPLTKADWTEVEPATRHMTVTSKSGQRVHRSEATKDAYKPTRHSTEAPRSDKRMREERISEAWQRVHALALALMELGVGPRGTGRNAVRLAETTLWLAGGAAREPGVPIFDRLPNESFGHAQLKKGVLLRGPRFGRNGATILRIECAADHDLAAVPVAQLSRAQHWQGHEDPQGNRGNPSQAKRAVREGRQLLHDLGAWPWAHADRGRLHEHGAWWQRSDFIDPLRRWLAHGWARFAFLEIARAKDALELEPGTTPWIAPARQSFDVLASAIAEAVVALDADSMVEALVKSKART